MSFRDMVTATNPAFIAAFGEPVEFTAGACVIRMDAIVNIAERVPWPIDCEDQTVLKSLDCDPRDAAWLTDDLIPLWRVVARGKAYNIAAVERNEMTTIYLADILPEED